MKGALSGKNRLASFRTPDEMINNEMDPMFISLVVHSAGICCIHGYKSTQYLTEMQEARAKTKIA
jgi:hypothetical protein